MTTFPDNHARRLRLLQTNILPRIPKEWTKNFHTFTFCIENKPHMKTCAKILCGRQVYRDFYGDDAYEACFKLLDWLLTSEIKPDQKEI